MSDFGAAPNPAVFPEQPRAEQPRLDAGGRDVSFLILLLWAR